jgi:hypothetical protein
MKRRLSLKSDTYTESMDVYAAGISVKVCAHYPGRSDRMFYFVDMVELGTHGATERVPVGNSRPKATKRNYCHKDMVRCAVRSQQRA